MKINFAQTDLRTLQSIAGDIGKNCGNLTQINKAREDLRKNVIAGLSRAVNAEVNRLQAAGLPHDGRIVFTLDFTFEFTEYPYPPTSGKKKSLIDDLEFVLRSREKGSKKNVLIY